MVSIKEIARVAGVSHSTVSRALRNSPLVNAKTAALIRKIADELISAKGVKHGKLTVTTTGKDLPT